MIKYYLFAWHAYEAHGGIDDCIFKTNNIDVMIAKLEELQTQSYGSDGVPWNLFQYYNSETGVKFKYTTVSQVLTHIIIHELKGHKNNF